MTSKSRTSRREAARQRERRTTGAKWLPPVAGLVIAAVAIVAVVVSLAGSGGSASPAATVLTGPPTVTGTANVMSAAVLARGTTTIRGAAVEPEIADLGRFLIAMGARIEGLGTPTIRIEGVEQLGGASHRLGQRDERDTRLPGERGESRLQIPRCPPHARTAGRIRAPIAVHPEFDRDVDRHERDPVLAADLGSLSKRLLGRLEPFLFVRLERARGVEVEEIETV